MLTRGGCDVHRPPHQILGLWGDEKVIRELEKMCQDCNFNKSKALELIAKTDVNQEFERSKELGFSYPTTLQAEAIDNCNIEMLKLLLDNGADPNFIYDNTSELWGLQYDGGESVEKDEIRLQMAQMLLEYGANPNMNPENEPEDLFQWVLFEMFEGPYDYLWKYRSRFFILLVAFGGKTSYCIPQIVREFDKKEMKQYSFHHICHEDGKYSGIICDKNNETIAYI